MSRVQELELGDIEDTRTVELPGDFSKVVTLVVTVSIEAIEPLVNGRPEIRLWWHRQDRLGQGDDTDGWNPLRDSGGDYERYAGNLSSSGDYFKAATGRYVLPLGDRVSVFRRPHTQPGVEMSALSTIKGVKVRWLAREMG